MEVGRRRGTTKNGVVEGSVWESRMKSDEFKGGIKVFNAEEKKAEENGEKKMRPKQSPIGANGKRKTWKSESSDGIERNPIQPRKELDQQCKELSVSSDGTKIKSPVPKIKKTRSEVGKGVSGSVDGIERNPNRIRKSKSESLKLVCQSEGEFGNGDEIERNSMEKMKTRSEEIKEARVSVDGSETNPVQIRRLKSQSLKLIGQSDVESGNGDGIEKNLNQLRKVKSESHRSLGESVDANERNSIPLTEAKLVPGEDLDDGNGRNSIESEAAKSEPDKGVDESVEEIETSPVGNEKSGCDESCKEFGVCEEKEVSCGLGNLGQVKSAPDMVVDEEDDDYDGDGDGDEEDDDHDDDGDEDYDDEEIEIDEEKKRFEVKEIDIVEEEKPKQIVNEQKKVQKVQEKPLPISPIVKKQVPPVVNHSRVHAIPTKTKASPVSNGFQKPPETNTGFQRVPHTHNKLQSLVDLVMWRDVSKSAFIFGLGTFIIISLSYTKDLNISFITVISYLGLAYLAAIFLFRSIICRGVTDVDYTSQEYYVVGEGEAMWLVKMVLPYLNEFLVKLRALFSGDPATTMKLAVLLFVLARCGSSITVWKMAKLGFFGVFTVPKICSSYSTQLSNYGNFWVRRFKDAWESCSHKKAVAFGIFTLVWNLSSVMARIWAVFMLYVAFRYYQQSLATDNWVEEEQKCETTWKDPIGEHRRGRRTATVDVKKDKKRF
ncbi:reticulon-like protein B21 [Rhododendron vialii]|uniref:reticulon-like protein B21 n=1 Tax=Rhododendron vialii TaxID=182163 RepID=UPI00265F119A|nr:reticulon-like protein B21 [Rhododendron vialii]